jgi:PLD-like domain
MGEQNFFLDVDPGLNISATTYNNDIDVYFEDKNLFERMGQDLLTASSSNDFVYLLNWWCDIDVPLGGSNLRNILSKIAADTSFRKNETPTEKCQVCAMFWRQKDRDHLGFPELQNQPSSIYGDNFLSAINTEAMKFIQSLNSASGAILDGMTALFGSHHQKLLLIKNKDELIGYVGSADFNLDRIFQEGTSVAKKKVTSKGAPEQDIHIRIRGPANQRLLDTFIDRWKLHPANLGLKLRGETYVCAASYPGNISLQVTHTYAKGYPFPNKGVSTAASAQLKLINSAKKYIYIEDQYLIGNPEIGQALRDRLNSNTELHIIAITTSVDISDLPLVKKRRSEFWYPLFMMSNGRVLLFEMLNLKGESNGIGSYLHAKFLMVDDLAAIVGSVNFSNRSWYHDSELSVTLAQLPDSISRNKIAGIVSPIVPSIRIRRWSRHLGEEAKNCIFSIDNGISAWKSLPPKALVRSWKPEAITLNPAERAFFESAIDPR